MGISPIEDVIEDYRHGRMVVLIDDEDRENEGDLMMAAAKVTADDINFMAGYGRGLICLTLTRERCKRLRLPLMVSDTDINYATNFTVSIEAAEGVTTGISAADRAHTIRVAVGPDARPEDLIQPGHIFPIMAQPGGVLTRAGHTEAGCDLAGLAGFEPASAIVEVLNEDGSMARRSDLEAFGQRHGIRIGTIADLIRYRVQHEKTVQRAAESELPTAYGRFRVLAYEDSFDGGLHFALVRGQIDPERPTLVRVHLQDTLCDLLGTRLPDCRTPLAESMERVAAEGAGVVVVLRTPEQGRDLVRRLHNYALHGHTMDDGARGRGAPDLRTYGLGAQILADVGVRRMRVLGTPKKVPALAGFGLELVEYVSR